MSSRCIETEKVSARNRRVVFINDSPFSRLKSVPICAVQMKEGFWKRRLDKNREITIPKQLQKIRESGVLDKLLTSVW